MKKIKLFISAFILILMSASVAVSAQVDVTINHTTGKMTISADSGESSYATLFVKHIESGSYVYGNLVYAGINGFSESFTLAEDADGGYYEVALIGNKSNAPDKAEIFYATEEICNEIMAIVQSAENIEAFDDALVVNNHVIGVDLEKYAEVRDHSIVFKTITEASYENPDEMRNAFDTLVESLIKQQIIDDGIGAYQKADTETLTEVLEAYKEIFSVTLDDTYYSYKSYVNELLIDAKIKSETQFSEEFKKAMSIPYVNSASRETLLGVIEKNDEYLGIYDLITEQTEEIQIKILKRIEANDYTDVSEIENDIDDVIDENKPSKSSGGGGGGSKKGSSVSVVMPSSVLQENVPSGENELQKAEGFNDLNSVSWAKESIEYLYEKGIVSGDGNGNFLPDNKVTRAEFTKMLVKAFEINAEAEIKFADVKEEDWYYTYVGRAAGSGIVNGVSDGSFAPNDEITRQDMAVMIYRCTKDIVAPEGEMLPFEDDADIADYAKTAVYALKNNDIISGVTNELFAPEQSCTRAQCAKVIYLVLKQGGKV